MINLLSRLNGQQYNHTFKHMGCFTSSTCTKNLGEGQQKSEPAPSTALQAPPKIEQPTFPVSLPPIQTLILKIALVNGQSKDLTVNFDIKGEQLKNKIYKSLSQELSPELMSLYYIQTKISNTTFLKNLSPSIKAGSKLTITQKKADLSDIRGLHVNEGEIDVYSEQVGVAKMNCGHFVGKESMYRIIQTAIKDKKYQIRCPYIKSDNKFCNQLWDFDLCKKVGVFTKTQRQKFENALTINKVNQQKECPYCNLPIIKQNLAGNRVLCPCGSVPFCFQCLKSWQKDSNSKQCGNKYCNFYKELVTHSVWNKSFELKGPNGQAKKYLTPQYRACVHCDAVITHSQKCKHMTCQYCNNKFCWVCLAVPVGTDYKCGKQTDYCGIIAKVQTLS